MALFKFSFWNTAIYPAGEIPDFLLNNSVQDLPGLCSACSPGCLGVPACPWQPTLEQSWQQLRAGRACKGWSGIIELVSLCVPAPSQLKASKLLHSSFPQFHTQRHVCLRYLTQVGITPVNREGKGSGDRKFKSFLATRNYCGHFCAVQSVFKQKGEELGRQSYIFCVLEDEIKFWQ